MSASDFRSFRPQSDLMQMTDDGRVNEPLTDTDAELLRRYKRFLMKHGLIESLWCHMCAALDQPEGLRASVMDAAIDLECRCTVRRHRGQTF